MAMTRRRVVTPEGVTRDEILSLPRDVRLTEILLRLYADDHGREKVNQRLMLARLYPMDRDMTESTIDEHLLLLDEADAITLYDASGSTFFSMTDWPKVDRPQDSRYPPPPSRSVRDPFVAGERERARERESEYGSEWDGERGHARTDRESGPPDPFCPAHPDGTDDPCRPCGVRRLRRKKWDDEQMAAARGVIFEGDA
ncbi:MULTISPECIES: hypothetical protein [unclassified Microbacterium]|uniref:hypothetical protein n=1 Tax=unclassified Microbacterium TaxID=2609290 RepID=UPI003018F5BB